MYFIPILHAIFFASHVMHARAFPALLNLRDADPTFIHSMISRGLCNLGPGVQCSTGHNWRVNVSWHPAKILTS